LSKFGIKFKGSDKITIKDILDHKTNIPRELYNKILTQHYNKKEKIITSWNKKDILDSLKDQTFKRSVFNYNSLHYSLVGIIIEKVSKLSVPQFIRKNILNPIGMKETSFHSKKNRELFDIQFPTFDIAGNMISTNEDLYKFINSELFKLIPKTTYYYDKNILIFDGFNEGPKGVMALIIKYNDVMFIGFMPSLTEKILKKGFVDKIFDLLIKTYR